MTKQMEPISVGTAMCVGDLIEKTREEGKTMDASVRGTFMMPEGDKVYTTSSEMIADQPMKDANRKIKWGGSWNNENFPKPDVDPYIADEETFQKIKDALMLHGSSANPKIGRSRIDDLIAEGTTVGEAVQIYNQELDNGRPVDLMSMACDSEAGFPLDKMEEYDRNFHLIVEDMIQALPLEHKIMEGSLDIESVKRERINIGVSLTDPKDKWEAILDHLHCITLR